MTRIKIRNGIAIFPATLTSAIIEKSLSRVQFKCDKFISNLEILGFKNELEYWEALLNRQEKVMNVAVRLSNSAHPDIFLPIIHDNKLYLLLFSFKLSTSGVGDVIHKAGIASTEMDEMYKKNYKKAADDTDSKQDRKLYEKMHPTISKLKKEASYILRIHVHAPMSDELHIINDKEALIFINQNNINWLLEKNLERDVVYSLYQNKYIEDFNKVKIKNVTKDKIIELYKKLVDVYEIAKTTNQRVETVDKTIKEYEEKSK